MIFVIFLLLNCTKKFDLLYVVKGVNEDRAISSLKRGDLELFKIYFSKLKDINFLDEEKNTLLHLAIKYKQKEVQNYLIDNFIDIRSETDIKIEDLTDDIELKDRLRNLRLCQELINAVKKSKKDDIKQIIKELSLVEIFKNSYNVVPRMMEFVSPQTLNFLIKEENILSFRDNFGNNIIHMLCRHNRLEPLMVILKNVENIDFNINKDRKSFLDIAIDNRNFELIHSVLIAIFNKEFKINTEIFNKIFLERLMKNSTIEIIDILIKNSIIEDYNINLNNLKTIISKEYWTVLKYLFRENHFQNYEDIVIDCIKIGSLSSLKKLNKIGINFKDMRLKNGNYLIHEYIYDKEILKFILKLFDIDKKNSRGDTIFHIIASNKNYPLDLLEYILGLDFELRLNDRGLSCIDIALLNRNIIFIQNFMKLRGHTLSLDFMKHLLKKAIEENYFNIINIISSKFEEQFGIK